MSHILGIDTEIHVGKRHFLVESITKQNVVLKQIKPKVGKPITLDHHTVELMIEKAEG